jgi:hypothetical protein
MIDIHVRISRKLVLWIVGILVVLTVLPFVLSSIGGHSSGGLKIEPVQSRPSP